MTRKLEELFDLPSPPEAATAESDNDIEHNLPVLSESLRELDKIEAALPLVKGLESSDIEMDDLAGKATESYENLMDLVCKWILDMPVKFFLLLARCLGMRSLPKRPS